MSHIKVNIDGFEIVTYRGKTILEVARENGIEVPTLCHSELIKNYGSCGICVVEVEGNPRLVRSCSTEIADGMVITTRSARIDASRITTLELMISDHTGDCKAPCVLGCPGQVDVQGYVGLIANGEFEEALKLIKKELPLPASIGRVCPHPCQSACRRGLLEDPVHIAWLKRYVADLDLEKESPYMPEILPQTGKSVGIIGGGPSGLSAAYYLRQKGHEVTIYEAMPEFGGMLKYGIPLYRLPKEVLLSEVKLVEKMGVTLRPNIKVGQDVTLDFLRARHDAVYVAVGAWRSAMMDCPGTDLKGVYGGIEFLNKFAVNDPIHLGPRIAVIGGGNTAMDAARTSVRLGAEAVYAIYRRTKADMPAVDVEIEEAEEEGVDFKFLMNPVEIIGDDLGCVKAIKLQKMMQTEPDASGRRNVVPVEGAFETIEVDAVIMSIGQQLLPIGVEALSQNRRGFIEADESTFMTNLEGVFAGGDCTNKGASIAIEAIADGKRAARVMDTYLMGQLMPYKPIYTVKKENVTAHDFLNVNVHAPAHMGHMSPEVRRKNFEEVVDGYALENALDEANRCLECGCHDVFECDLYRLANEYPVKPDRFDGDKTTQPLYDDHPYILRDQNKCILCGMCVRVCDEVMDVAALGLVNRGFDTVVAPELGKAFDQTKCVSCGQCVTLCPTGALQEKRPIHKQVPLEAEKVETVCGGCSLGCAVEMEKNGELLLRALPFKTNAIDKAVLCKVGRFGFADAGEKTRILTPMIRKEGVLTPVTYQEALLYVARKAQSLQLLYGPDVVAVSAGDQWVNEALAITHRLASDILKTNQIYATDAYEIGVKSANKINELLETEVIITLGVNLGQGHGVLGTKLKASKAKLLNVNDERTVLDDWAKHSVIASHVEQVIFAMAKTAYENAKGDKSLLEAQKNLFDHVVIPASVYDLMSVYLGAKKAMVVYNVSKLSLECQKLIEGIAVACGHIGSPREGIIALKKGVNGMGLVDMGFNPASEVLRQESQKGSIRGLLAFGGTENTSLEAFKGLDFLMVMDAFETPLMAYADVVLPAKTLLESRGTVTSTDNRVQKVNAVVQGPISKSNIELVADLMNTFSTNTKIKAPEDLKDYMKKVYGAAYVF